MYSLLCAILYLYITCIRCGLYHAMMHSTYNTGVVCTTLYGVVYTSVHEYCIPVLARMIQYMYTYMHIACRMV